MKSYAVLTFMFGFGALASFVVLFFDFFQGLIALIVNVSLTKAFYNTYMYIKQLQLDVASAERRINWLEHRIDKLENT